MALLTKYVRHVSSQDRDNVHLYPLTHTYQANESMLDSLQTIKQLQELVRNFTLWYLELQHTKKEALCSQCIDRI